MRRANSDAEEAAFASAAMVVPAAEAAMGYNPIVVLLISLTVLAMCIVAEYIEIEIPNWMTLLRMMTYAGAVIYFLGRTGENWPAKGADYAVPIVLLGLALYAVLKGAGRKSSNVLRYGMYGIMFLIIVSGAANMHWSSYIGEWRALEPGMLFVLVLPIFGSKKKDAGIASMGSACIMSVLATGTIYDSIYAYSRSLTIRGVTEHMESLTACAVTVGWFTTLCWLITNLEKDAKKIFLKKEKSS